MTSLHTKGRESSSEYVKRFHRTSFTELQVQVAEHLEEGERGAKHTQHGQYTSCHVMSCHDSGSRLRAREGQHPPAEGQRGGGGRLPHPDSCHRPHLVKLIYPF